MSTAGSGQRKRERDVLERRMQNDARNVRDFRNFAGSGRASINVHATVIADCAARLLEVRSACRELESDAWENLKAALSGWRST